MPKPLMPATQLQRVSEDVNMFSPISETRAQPSRAEQALQTLNDVLPQVADEGTSEIMKIVNADKVRQKNRALARIEPTEDATIAGRAAWKAVGDRNQGSEVIRELNGKAATFEGTDEEWDNEVVTAQDKYLDSVGRDPSTLSTAAKIFQEGLPKIADTRFKAKQQQDQVAKYRTTISSLTQATQGDFSPEQIRQNITQTFQEAKAMGMGSEATRKALVDAAINQAGNDDLTLLDYTKELGIYGQEPGLISAERSANNRLAQKEAGEVAINKQGLIDQLNASPNMSFSEYARRAQSQRTREGLPVWTEKQIRSTYERAQKKHDSDYKVGNYFQQSMKRMYDETVDPVAFDNMTGKEKKALIDNFDTWQSKKLAQEISANPDPAAQQTLKKDATNFKAQWLAENGLVDPKWKAQFNLLDTMDASTMEGDKLPTAIASALSRMDDLQNSQGVLQTHASDKAIAIHNNFDKNLQGGYNEVQAYQLAVTQANNPPVVFTAKQSKEFTKEVNSAVKDTFNHSWFSSTDDLSKEQAPTIERQVQNRAKSLMRANVDPDTAIQKAISEVTDTHTQLKNGSIVYGKKQWLSQKMGVTQDRVDDLLDTFPQKIVELEGTKGYEGVVSNTPTPPEKWIPVVSPNGLVVYKDELGARVTRPFTLNEIGGISNKERFDKLNNEQAELRKARIRQQNADKAVRETQQDIGGDISLRAGGAYSNYVGE